MNPKVAKMLPDPQDNQLTGTNCSRAQKEGRNGFRIESRPFSDYDKAGIGAVSTLYSARLRNELSFFVVEDPFPDAQF